ARAPRDRAAVAHAAVDANLSGRRHRGPVYARVARRADRLGELLQRPAVAVGVAEVGVGHGRLAGGAHVLDLGDLDPALQQLLAGGVDVVDHQVEGLDRARGRVDDADPDADRAGRAGRGELDDPEGLAEAFVEVGGEAARGG